MYEYMRGQIVDKSDNKLIVDVNNIGYRIMVPTRILDKYKIDEIVKIYTYLNVREDEMSLYGFDLKEELNLFEKLISINGVGPRVAIGMLSNMECQAICVAIAVNDSNKLTKVPGIGQKMACRIILELKDKIKKENLVNQGNDLEVIKSYNNEVIDEIIFALQTLGYGLKEIKSAINGECLEEISVEQGIKIMLKKLGKNR